MRSRSLSTQASPRFHAAIVAGIAKKFGLCRPMRRLASSRRSPSSPRTAIAEASNPALLNVFPGDAH